MGGSSGGLATAPRAHERAREPVSIILGTRGGGLDGGRISTVSEGELGGAARSCWVVRAGWEGPVEAKPLPLEPMGGLEILSTSSLGLKGEGWREGGPFE